MIIKDILSYLVPLIAQFPVKFPVTHFRKFSFFGVDVMRGVSL